MTKKEKEAWQIDAFDYLHKVLKPGSIVNCILRHVSKSGMTRAIDFYTFRVDKETGKVLRHYLTPAIETVAGYRQNKRHGGLTVGGCGMDMGFSVVYNLSYAMYPDGFIPADAGLHGRNGTPATELDTNGGYALKHEWL